MLDIVVIASTNGGVLGRLLEIPFFKQRVRAVVSDRQCKAIDVAVAHGIPANVYLSKDGLVFSNTLLAAYKNKAPTLFVAFYSRLFRGDFLKFSKYRLVNLHPSILPACPGQDGFGDTVKSGSKFIGATLHLVDEGMDTGFPIIQSACPFDARIDIQESRHRIFIQQCKMLLQFVKWVEEKRYAIDRNGCPSILNARYEIGEFSPNLDFNLALEFEAISSVGSPIYA